MTMLMTWLLRMCGVQLPSLMAAGPIGIGVGLLAAGLASANLLLDFDMIKRWGGGGEARARARVDHSTASSAWIGLDGLLPLVHPSWAAAQHA